MWGLPLRHPWSIPRVSLYPLIRHRSWCLSHKYGCYRGCSGGCRGTIGILQGVLQGVYVAFMGHPCSDTFLIALYHLLGPLSPPVTPALITVPPHIASLQYIYSPHLSTVALLGYPCGSTGLPLLHGPLQ